MWLPVTRIQSRIVALHVTSNWAQQQIQQRAPDNIDTLITEGTCALSKLQYLSPPSHTILTSTEQNLFLFLESLSTAVAALLKSYENQIHHLYSKSSPQLADNLCVNCQLLTPHVPRLQATTKTASSVTSRQPRFLPWTLRRGWFLRRSNTEKRLAAILNHASIHMPYNTAYPAPKMYSNATLPITCTYPCSIMLLVTCSRSCYLVPCNFRAIPSLVTASDVINSSCYPNQQSLDWSTT